MRKNRESPAAATGLRHVGIVMDGNGRWAEARGLARSEGHRAGFENAKEIIPFIFQNGVETLTVYAFSTENWARSEGEVGCLLELFGEAIAMAEILPKISQENIRLRFIGDRVNLSERGYGLFVDIMEELERGSAQNTGGTFVIAINYGGKSEITRAIKKMILANVHPSAVRETTLSIYLDTHGLPDVDLIIRTAGERRISNFLLYQGAYAEFYHSRKTWPDFGKRDFLRAVDSFLKRKRKMGGY